MRAIQCNRVPINAQTQTWSSPVDDKPTVPLANDWNCAKAHSFEIRTQQDSGTGRHSLLKLHNAALTPRTFEGTKIESRLLRLMMCLNMLWFPCGTVKRLTFARVDNQLLVSYLIQIPKATPAQLDRCRALSSPRRHPKRLCGMRTTRPRGNQFCWGLLPFGPCTLEDAEVRPPNSE
jgi:hypothetical protein